MNMTTKLLQAGSGLLQKMADWSAWQQQVFDRWIDGDIGAGIDSALAYPYANIIWVYICARKVATSISEVPLKFYNGETEITDGTIVTLFDGPNKETNRHDLIAGIVLFLKLNGEAFVVQSEQLANGVPGAMWFADPRTTTYDLTSNKRAIENWKVISGGNTDTVPPERMMHIKQFNPYHAVRGQSDIQALRVTLEGSLGAQRYNRDYFRNGVAAGMHVNFENKPSDADVERYKAALAQNHSVKGQGHKPFVTWGKTTVTPGLSQKDMEFLSYIKLSREEQCAALGTPPSLVGLLEYANYANMEVQERIFWEQTCSPILRMIEWAINRDLLTRYNQKVKAKFDTSGIRALQEVLTTKISDGYKLWTMGANLTSINDRLGLGLDVEDIESADISFVPMSMIPYSEDTTPDEPAPVPSGNDDDPTDDSTGDDAKAARKRAKARRSIDREAIWKRYVASWQPLENKYAAKLSNFFFDLRKETLKKIDDYLSQEEKTARKKEVRLDILDEVIFDTTKAKTRVARISMPFIQSGVKIGVDQVTDTLGSDAIAFNWETDQNIISFLQEKEIKITELVNTVDRQVRQRIQQVVEETIAAAAENGTAMSVAEAIYQAGDEIADAARRGFNAAGGRAMNIARTELGEAVSMSREQGFKANGVQELEWITAGDENVRESHLENDGEVRKIGEPFPNGLTRPNETGAPPAEVINCRCVKVPAASSD